MRSVLLALIRYGLKLYFLCGWRCIDCAISGIGFGVVSRAGNRISDQGA